MAKWHLGELNVGDSVLIEDIWGHDAPVETKITRIQEFGNAAYLNEFHIEPVVSGGTRATLFGYSGLTFDKYHRVALPDVVGRK